MAVVAPAVVSVLLCGADGSGGVVEKLETVQGFSNFLLHLPQVPPPLVEVVQVRLQRPVVPHHHRVCNDTPASRTLSAPVGLYVCLCLFFTHRHARTLSAPVGLYVRLSNVPLSFSHTAMPYSVSVCLYVGLYVCLCLMFVVLSIKVWARERETETETEREGETERQRERETDIETERDRVRERQRESESEQSQRQRQSQRDSEPELRARERQRDRDRIREKPLGGGKREQVGGRDRFKEEYRDTESGRDGERGRWRERIE